jgi:hypothetical protein
MVLRLVFLLIFERKFIFIRSKTKFFSSGNSDEIFSNTFVKTHSSSPKGSKEKKIFFPRGFDFYGFFAYGQRKKTLTILHLMAI